MPVYPGALRLANHPGVDRFRQHCDVFILQWIGWLERVVVRWTWHKAEISKPVTELLQLRVLRLGLLKDRNVRVGVLPEREESLVGGAALGSVALHSVGAAQLEVSQRADRFIQDDAPMVEDFLKLCCRFATPVRRKIGFSPYVDRIQIRPVKNQRAGRPSSYEAATPR